MTPATEVKMVAFKNKSQALSGESKAIQTNIDNHKKAALHHELAAKYHLETARHYASGNFYQAEESALIAQGHYTIAGQYQGETTLVFSW